MPPTIYLNALLWLIVGMLLGAAVATFRQKTRTMNRLFMIVGGVSAVLGGMINFVLHLVSSDRFIFIRPLDWALSFTQLGIAAGSALIAVILLQLLAAGYHLYQR